MTNSLNPSLWLDQYGDTLFRYALLRVGNKDVAEDLLQDTLLAGWRGRERFAQQSSELTWLTGILKHKIIDYFRTCKREQTHDDIEQLIDHQDFDHRDHWAITFNEWDHPEQALQQDAFWQTLQHCIQAMPERLADAFIMREIQGLSNEEICKVLDIPTTNSLWVNLSRARQRLRDCLNQHWFNTNKPQSKRR